MEKLKTICKWVGVDGLLHFLVCYAMMLAFTPVVGVWWAIFSVTAASLVKEWMDFFIQQDNDRDAVWHDFICDGAGILAALITMAIWMV
jgi:hypothetical protein